jgi:hypothetical protein
LDALAHLAAVQSHSHAHTPDIHHMTLEDFLISIGASVLAAFIVWILWWIRIRHAAGQFCGTWNALELVGRELKTMPGSGTTTITWKTNLFHPGDLHYAGEYDGSQTEGKVRLIGVIRVDPVALNRAVLSGRRDGAGTEYFVQDYHLMGNGDIYVVPVTSDWSARLTPDGQIQVQAVYNKHVLQKQPASSADTPLNRDPDPGSTPTSPH